MVIVEEHRYGEGMFINYSASVKFGYFKLGMLLFNVMYIYTCTPDYW
jgi:hypothetical protein